jgi:hypothetical protein
MYIQARLLCVRRYLLQKHPDFATRVTVIAPVVWEKLSKLLDHASLMSKDTLYGKLQRMLCKSNFKQLTQTPYAVLIVYARQVPFQKEEDGVSKGRLTWTF